MPNVKDFQYVTTNCGPNWHDNTGCQYPLVCPKGTKVKFIRQFTNCYGTWFEVEYEGKSRYIMPSLCDGNVIVGVKTVGYSPVLLDKEYIFIDRYGKRYKQVNVYGDLEEL